MAVQRNTVAKDDKVPVTNSVTPTGQRVLDPNSVQAIFAAPNSYIPTPSTADVFNGQDQTDINAAKVAQQKAAAAVAAANAAAKSSSRSQNQNTADLATGQYKLLQGFGTARDVKLANIGNALEAGEQSLLQNYGLAFGGLQGNKEDNEKSEADASFGNIANAVRERGSMLEQAATQGAGETDALRAQLQALRNYSANQGEVNRSFFDTARSINNSISSLNSDTATGRVNLFNQSEADREAAWANFYNQSADTWTQIQNIENSNSNVNSAASEAYTKLYGSAGDEAAKATAGAYLRQAAPTDLSDWAGKGKTEQRSLGSSNRAAVVNLGGAQKTAEGATLRKGF